MKELLDLLLEWRSQEKQAALATVLQTWGSSPRQVGAHMVVDRQGEFAGSVSGGCVETAVVHEALVVIARGKPKRIKYGVSDDEAWEVGLACGGEIEVFISPVSWDEMDPILNLIRDGEPCTYTIQLEGSGKISIPQIDQLPLELPFLDQTSESERIFLHVAPDSEIFIVGGVNISQKLVPLAKLMGYKTAIIDPRRSFASENRFPLADLIVNSWPEDAFNNLKITSNTAIVILSHDDKIDIPALSVALNSPAFYIGALGSKKTQTRRKNTLHERGFPEETLARIHGPIGLDIGAKEPAEIAFSIMAEIIAVANLNRGRIKG